MFSKTSEYALRAVCLVAGRAGESHTTEEIAKGTQVPQAYLSKVVQALRRGGILKTQRGIGGGISLALPPEEITVYDVVHAADPIQRIGSCPLGLAEHGVKLCPMHSQLDDALELMEQALQSTTIADLLNPQRRRSPRCQFPNVRLT